MCLGEQQDAHEFFLKFEDNLLGKLPKQLHRAQKLYMPYFCSMTNTFYEGLSIETKETGLQHHMQSY